MLEWRRSRPSTTASAGVEGGGRLPVNAISMTFHDRLKKCFRLRPVPKLLFSQEYLGDPDRVEASLLLGLEWDRVDENFFSDHSASIYALNPESFCYYLPSMLSFSYGGVLKYEQVTDLLIGLLDLSGDEKLIPEFTRERFFKLDSRQFDCLEEWLASLERAGLLSDETLAERVNLTVMLMRDLAGSDRIDGDSGV